MSSRGRKFDADIEIMNPGTIRTPRHTFRKSHRFLGYTEGKHCPDCDKQGFPSEEIARQVIGRVAHLGKLKEKGSFTVQPYLCPHGWWHFGRNRRVMKMFDDLAKKKNIPVPSAAAQKLLKSK